MERGWERRVQNERNDEMFDQLAEAVFAGDLGRAEGVLGEMHAVGYKSEAIRRAKRRARPELRANSQLPEPLEMPVPGHAPGSYMGRPITSKKTRVTA